MDLALFCVDLCLDLYYVWASKRKSYIILVDYNVDLANFCHDLGLVLI